MTPSQQLARQLLREAKRNDWTIKRSGGSGQFFSVEPWEKVPLSFLKKMKRCDRELKELIPWKPEERWK